MSVEMIHSIGYFMLGMAATIFIGLVISFPYVWLDKKPKNHKEINEPLREKVNVNNTYNDVWEQTSTK